MSRFSLLRIYWGRRSDCDDAARARRGTGGLGADELSHTMSNRSAGGQNWSKGEDAVPAADRSGNPLNSSGMVEDQSLPPDEEQANSQVGFTLMETLEVRIWLSRGRRAEAVYQGALRFIQILGYGYRGIRWFAKELKWIVPFLVPLMAWLGAKYLSSSAVLP